MIYQILTKEVITVKAVWTSALISMDFDHFTYFSVYSLVFVSIEKIYQRLGHCLIGDSNTSNSSKILRCASYFQLSSRCLDIPMKHCFSCLIYYLKRKKRKEARKRGEKHFLGRQRGFMFSVLEHV